MATGLTEDSERVDAMVHRVMQRAAREPVNRSDLLHIESDLSSALERRIRILGDSHHIDALHPARTVLILLDDAALSDPDVLRAACRIESHVPMLAEPAPIPDVATVPTPLTTASGELLEALLCLPRSFQLAALAERLDQCRHVHLRQHAEWPGMAASADEIYLPLASRFPGPLQRRFERWRFAFSRRLGADRGNEGEIRD